MLGLYRKTKETKLILVIELTHIFIILSLNYQGLILTDELP